MPSRKRAVRRFARASLAGRLAGWRRLVLENELLRVVCLPEYGGWIVSACYKPRDLELLWQSPRGLLARDDPPAIPDPLAAYHARSPGGWPEIFPHGSAAAEIRGAKMPFHGEAVNRAWRCRVLAASGKQAAALTAVDCHLLPLGLERVLRVEPGRAALFLEETVVNRSALAVDFMWGHHPIFGPPLLSGASRIHAPAARSLTGDFRPAGWPAHAGRDLALCPARGAASSEMFYLDGLSAGWCALVNPELRLGAALAWDPAVFPFVWVWREAGGARGYPYFGGAYAAALEPFSSLPGARQRGERLLRLEGGARLVTRLCLAVFEGAAAPAAVSLDGEVRGA